MKPSAHSTIIQHEPLQEQAANSIAPDKMAPDIIDSPNASNTVELAVSGPDKTADEHHDPSITLENLPAKLRNRIL